MKRLISIFICLLIGLFFINCGAEEELAGELGLVGASEAILDLPNCISEQSVSKSRCNEQDNEKPEDSGDVFDPVRFYVGLADIAAEIVREIVGYMISHPLPDTYEGVDENGDKIVISTPGDTIDGITYDKKIEIYKISKVSEEPTVEEQYFEINYMKNEIRGIIICKPNIKDSSELITGISIYYDGTDETKAMDVKLTAIDHGVDPYGYLSCLRLDITKLGSIFTMEGGAQVTDFIFGGEIYTRITEDRTYMIKAKADEDDDLAVAQLGLPHSENDEKVNLYEDWSISESFLELFLRWVTHVDNGDLWDIIDYLLSPYVTDWDADTAKLKDAIDQFYADPEYAGELDEAFYFLLNLENPVGFDSEGYDSNGENLDPKFNDLNDGFDLNANISPSEISQILIDFGV